MKIVTTVSKGRLDIVIISITTDFFEVDWSPEIVFFKLANHDLLTFK